MPGVWDYSHRDRKRHADAGCLSATVESADSGVHVEREVGAVKPKLLCARCGNELAKTIIDGQPDKVWVWPCACQKPKSKEYEPVFIEAKGLGGLPHD